MLSINTGGSFAGGCCDGNCGGLYGVNRVSLNTGCIRFHVFGSANRYAESPSFLTIVNGPYRLLSSFQDGRVVVMLVASSQTLSLG